MYGNSVSGMETPGGEGPFYRGALLVTMRTIVPYLEHGIQITNVEPIAAIQMVRTLTRRLETQASSITSMFLLV